MKGYKSTRPINETDKLRIGKVSEHDFKIQKACRLIRLSAQGFVCITIFERLRQKKLRPYQAMTNAVAHSNGQGEGHPFFIANISQTVTDEANITTAVKQEVAYYPSSCIFTLEFEPY